MSNKYTDMANQLFQAMTSKPTPNGSAPLSAERAIHNIQNSFESFTNYVNTVIQYELTVPMLRFKYDGEDFKDHYKAVDGRRHDAHSAAIASVCTMNRLCEHYGVESMLPNIGIQFTRDVETNPNIRSEVADFCGEFVLDTFVHRDGREYNDITLSHNTSLNMAQEPHLDRAVHAANKQHYTARIPVDRSLIDDSSISQKENNSEFLP